ncbi:MAG TPA: hypothetical protein VF743_11560 [Acidimicrobiales bacterium]
MRRLIIVGLAAAVGAVVVYRQRSIVRSERELGLGDRPDVRGNGSAPPTASGGRPRGAAARP